MKKNNTNKYFIYTRKSNEAEDRQIQSLPAQVRIMKEFAKKNDYEVVDIIEEAKSAKAPGRPKFNEMLERIHKGEANGILAWHLNRLARNSIDGGQIIWILQEGIVQHIGTPNGSYYPDTNSVVMHVELGVANEYVRALSRDTKRGINERAEKRGYPNGIAPTGYLNDLTREAGDRGWVTDEERFDAVKKMLEHFLTGAYSVKALTKLVHDKYNLTTPKHKSTGGKLISQTQVWNLLRSPVYAGFFFAKDVRHDLNTEVPRMISEKEYWHIQNILGRRGCPRPQKRVNEYAESAKCGHCGCQLVIDVKNQLVCSECKHKFSYPNKEECPKCGTAISKMKSPVRRHYRFLHCSKSKRKRGVVCPAKSIQTKKFDEAMVNFAENDFGMSSALSQWCIDNIGILQNRDLEELKVRKVGKEQAIARVKKQMVRMVEVRMNIEDPTSEQEEAFTTKEHELKKELERLQSESGVGTTTADWFENAREHFDIAVEIKDVFINGTEEDKKRVLLALGSNLHLNDKNISIINTKCVQAIVDGLKTAKARNAGFEPTKCTMKDILMLEQNSTSIGRSKVSIGQQKTAISGGFVPVPHIDFSMEFSEANASKELSGNVRPGQDLTTSDILLRELDSNQRPTG